MDSLNLKPLVEAHGVTGLILFGLVAGAVGMTIWIAASWYRLSHVPGPLAASLTGFWAYRASMSGHYADIVRDIQEKYGKVARIAPNDVMISDPDTLWRMSSARSVYGRGGWYSSIRFNPYGESVFSEMDTTKHDKRKSKLIFGFSGKGLMDIESNVDAQIAILVDVLKQKIAGGGGNAVIDFGRMLQNFQVDLITLSGMGKAWGNLATDKDHFDYLKSGDETFAFIQSAAMVPSLRNIMFSPLWLRLAGSDPTAGWLGSLKQAVARQISDDTDEKSHDTMLAEWLKHKMSPTEAELDLSVQLPAGTETSINTIRGTLLYLMTTPRIHQKLRKEISDGIRDGRISKPMTGDEAKNLPYLQAVINEGLRVANPVIAGFPKKVPPGGDVVCGKKLPGGTDVHVNFQSLMRDREVFGDDVDIFRPERFIEADDETLARRRKVVDLLFGFGRWLCLGRVLALLELNKIFVELLREFDFQVANPEKPWKRESAATVFIQGFVVRVSASPIG